MGYNIEKEEIKDRIWDIIGETRHFYLILRHVSQSKMTRAISVLIIRNNEVRSLDYFIAKLLDKRIHKHGGVLVKEVGLDLGLYILTSLFWELTGDYEQVFTFSWL